MKILSLLGLMILLAGCQPTIYMRGNFVDLEDAEKIKIGQDTRAQIKVRFGAPTFVQMFKGNKWYYIGERTQELAFFKPEIIAREIIIIDFDDTGLVSSVERQQSTENFDFELNERVTATHGRDPSLLKEVFGSVAIGDEGKMRKGMVSR